MKKDYLKPELDVHEMELESMIAATGSGSGSGSDATQQGNEFENAGDWHF
jgi:hypothetical protein